MDDRESGKGCRTASDQRTSRVGYLFCTRFLVPDCPVFKQLIYPSLLSCSYAAKYSCPHVFCFDGRTLVLLQFAATTENEIKDPACPIDAWVLPRSNLNGIPLRLAFYRLLVQGFRRCQGLYPNTAISFNPPPYIRRFYDGEPLWKVDGKRTRNPWGYRRQINRQDGSFFWVQPYNDEAVLDQNQNVFLDTLPFWELPSPAPQPAATTSIAMDMAYDDDLYD